MGKRKQKERLGPASFKRVADVIVNAADAGPAAPSSMVVAVAQVAAGPYSETCAAPGVLAAVFSGLNEEEKLLIEAAGAAILRVRRSSKTLAKHPPFDYRRDPIDEHLDAAAGHCIRGARIRRSRRAPDGESHIDEACCRTAIAARMELEGKRVVGGYTGMPYGGGGGSIPIKH